MVECQTPGWLDVEKRNEGVQAEEEVKEGEEGRNKGGEEGIPARKERTLATREGAKLGSVDAADGQRKAEWQVGLRRNSVQQLQIWKLRQCTVQTVLTVIVPFRCILM